VSDSLEVSLAARYDDYDLFGSSFSPQVAAKYTVSDNLSLRASWGEGFKAPDLTNLFSAPSESNNAFTDVLRCTAQGISESNCGTFQVLNISGGNPNLKAEESENFNVGVIADVGGFSASLDYYNVEINDQITRLTLEEVNDLEASGNLPAGAIVNRAGSVDGVPGIVRSIIRPFINAAKVETQGLDLNANYAFESGIGNWDVGLQWVHILSFEEQNTVDSDVVERVNTSIRGDTGFPENRINTNLRLNTGDLTFSFNSQFIDSFENPSEDGEYESWLSHDVTINWLNAFNVDGLEFTAGVQNITEEEPSIDSTGTYDATIVLSQYSLYGRVPFVNFKYSFGQ